MKGFIVHPYYVIKADKAFVHLYGRLESGESFLLINEFKPYFFIKKSDLKQAESLGDFGTEEKVDGIILKTFDEEPVIKIILNIPSKIKPLRDRFLENNIKCYEADIRFEYRFMIDNLLQGGVEIKGTSEKGDFTDLVFKEPKLSPINYVPNNLKVLAIDIETDKNMKDIWSVSLYNNDYKKVIIVSDKKLKNIIYASSEKDLLFKFQEELLKINSDIITGWNMIDFDLHIIEKKFKDYNIPFLLGRGNHRCSIRRFQSFFQNSRAEFPGRIILDGIQALKNNFINLPNYKLETAAKKFTKESKIFKGEDRYKQISDAYKHNTQLFVDYNLLDSKLAYDILYNSDVLNLSIQRSLLTGMPLDRVRASIASFDSVYLKKLRKKGYVASTSSYDPNAAPGKGGYVMTSKPGIYDYVIVCDFKSLYPSIVRTFNIDPWSYVKDCKGRNLIKAPNGACFKNQDGILPDIIQSFWKQREKARKQGNELARYAIKILMNSFYGVLGNVNCRFHNREVSNAITYFAQHFIKMTAKMVKEKGYEVIYGDTDSCFINLKVENYKEAEKIGEQIATEINKFFKKHIKKEYDRENFLELEFEKVYKRFLMPRVRGSETGSKKRYAGIIESSDGKEKIDFVGLEFVRRDWTDLAKTFQAELFDRIFHKKEVADYVKQLVKEVRKGKHDDLLVYRRSIRKKVSEYTKITPPHVKAARILGDKLESNLIEYVMTTEGPEPIQKQTHQIDYEHYIKKQMKPIADAVLGFYNESFDDILTGSTQKSLFGF